MSKQEFLIRLREGLSGLPQDDVAERLAFYAEMIDDRVEDGVTEKAAVGEIGPVDEIVAQIIGETPIAALVRERVRAGRHLQAWELVLLVLGSPLWLSLLAAACVVLISACLVLWAVVLSLWAADGALIASTLYGMAAGILHMLRGDGLPGLAVIGASLALAGLSIFLFFGCRAAAGGAMDLTRKIAQGTKSLFLRKESAR